MAIDITSICINHPFRDTTRNAFTNDNGYYALQKASSHRNKSPATHPHMMGSAKTCFILRFDKMYG